MSIECSNDVNTVLNNEINKMNINIFSVNSDNLLPKKRGRKPKNSKIIIEEQEKKNIDTLKTHVIEKPNVILHLKCSLNDLNESSSLNKVSFEESIEENDFYDKNQTQEPLGFNSYLDQNMISASPLYSSNDFTVDTLKKDENTIEKKLNQLQSCLNKNDINKSSCCFWCTYDFKTIPIHIPKYIYKNEYNVYGHFCSPECATGYLMNEKIDSSIKFERYALLNNLYSDVFNYTSNIKCAPSPYYLLNKYCGNLTIEEYRNMNKSKFIYILDKPLIKLMPELHQEKNIGS